MGHRVIARSERPLPRLERSFSVELAAAPTDAAAIFCIMFSRHEKRGSAGSTRPASNADRDRDGANAPPHARDSSISFVKSTKFGLQSYSEYPSISTRYAVNKNSSASRYGNAFTRQHPCGLLPVRLTSA